MRHGPLFDDWPFNPHEPGSYGLIVADPPWSFDNWSAKGEKKNPKSHYSCMGLPDIKALPVADLGARDCLLWLWATNPMLPQAIEVMEAWGFQFKTAGTWVKTTKHGKLAFGTGYVLRSCSEPFLIGRRGKPAQGAKNIRSAFLAEAREHSRKPDDAYAMAERMAPAARRIELFSRVERQGWATWGDEAGKLGEAR